MLFQGRMEPMHHLLQLWLMPLLVLPIQRSKRKKKTNFILQVTLPALKSVPSICSCSVCLGGSRGTLILLRLLKKAGGS